MYNVLFIPIARCCPECLCVTELTRLEGNLSVIKSVLVTSLFLPLSPLPLFRVPLTPALSPRPARPLSFVHLFFLSVYLSHLSYVALTPTFSLSLHLPSL